MDVRILRERAEEIEDLVYDGAFCGRDVAERIDAGMREALPDEAAGVVVFEAEDFFSVGFLEVCRGVYGELLEDEFLHRSAQFRLYCVVVRIELGRRVGGGIVAVLFKHAGIGDSGRGGAKILVPSREEVHQTQAVGEVRGVLHEASAVGHEAGGFGSIGGDFAHRFHFGFAGGRGEEVGGAGDRGQFLLRVAEREGGGLDFGREGLEADLGSARGGRAVGVDRGLDGEDAAGRQRLASVVVAKQHRLLHARRDLGLAAEHVGDRVLEDVSRAVVHSPLSDAARPFVDGVALGDVDRDRLEAAGRLVELCVRDGLAVFFGDVRLCKISERLESGVVSIDVE